MMTLTFSCRFLFKWPVVSGTPKPRLDSCFFFSFSTTLFPGRLLCETEELAGPLTVEKPPIIWVRVITVIATVDRPKETKVLERPEMARPHSVHDSRKPVVPTACINSKV